MRHLFLLPMLLVLPIVCGASAAQARDPGDSYLTLAVQGRHIDGQWDIALRDLDAAMSLDQDGDGQLTWDEVRSQHRAIAAYALQRLDLSTEQGRCSIAVAAQLIDRRDDDVYTVLRFHAECPNPVTTLAIAYRLFADADSSHRGLVQITRAGQTSTAIFGRDDARQEIGLGEPDRWTRFNARVQDAIGRLRDLKLPGL
jgi:hypothetical protein